MVIDLIAPKETFLHASQLSNKADAQVLLDARYTAYPSSANRLQLRNNNAGPTG